MPVNSCHAHASLPFDSQSMSPFLPYTRIKSCTLHMSVLNMIAICHPSIIFQHFPLQKYNQSISTKLCYMRPKRLSSIIKLHDIRVTCLAALDLPLCRGVWPSPTGCSGSGTAPASPSRTRRVILEEIFSREEYFWRV
jgi:hypothetical protein